MSVTANFFLQRSTLSPHRSNETIKSISPHSNDRTGGLWLSHSSHCIWDSKLEIYITCNFYGIKVEVRISSKNILQNFSAERDLIKLTHLKTIMNPLPVAPQFPTEAQFDVEVDTHDLCFSSRLGDFIRCVDISTADADVRDGDVALIEYSDDEQEKVQCFRRVRRNGGRYEFWPTNGCDSQVIVRDDSIGIGADVKILAKSLWIYRRL